MAMIEVSKKKDCDFLIEWIFVMDFTIYRSWCGFYFVSLHLQRRHLVKIRRVALSSLIFCFAAYAQQKRRKL